LKLAYIRNSTAALTGGFFYPFSPSRFSIDSNDLDSIDAPSKNELERRENALNVGGGGK
jgi:hypothetical protein